MAFLRSFGLLLVAFMAGGTSDGSDDEELPPDVAAAPARRPRGRPRTVSLVAPQAQAPPAPAAAAAVLVAAGGEGPAAAGGVAQANAADTAAMQLQVQELQTNMHRILQLLGDSGNNAAAAGAAAAGAGDNSIPSSPELQHIRRQSLEFWDNHPAGTPLDYKDLPPKLRSAMDKNPRDRLEVTHAYTALTLSATLLDILYAIVQGAEFHLAEIGMDLILNHLAPMLGRRVDALQQNGALRTLFSTAQDPHSQYFIADPKSSLAILQKVSSARVQAIMTKAKNEVDAGRRSGTRDGDSQSRQASGGSQRSRTRSNQSNGNRRNNTSNNNNGNGGSNRRGTSRERGSRERGSNDRSGARSSSSAPPSAGSEERN